MNLPTRILVLLATIILALSLGLACEGGEEVTREDVEEALLEALGDDADLEAIEEGVREALDAEVPTGTSTPLHDVAAFGTVAEAQALLDEGADVDARDADGRTPLYQAANFNDDPGMIQLLVDAGADTEAKSMMFGRTPLHQAVQFGSAPVVEALLDQGANIEAEDDRGSRPLDMVLFNDSLEMVELLLARGADPNAKPYLLSAARSGNPGLARLLLDNGGNTEFINAAGETALHHAAMNDFLEVVRVLLDRGADIEARDDVIRRTALLYAAQSASLELVTLLLDRGAEINIQDDTRDTPLHLAFENSPAVVELLLDRGADPTIEGNGGITPCNRASRWEGYAGTPLEGRMCRAEAVAVLDTIERAERPDFGPVSTITPHLRPGYTEFDLHWISETPLHRTVVEGDITEVQRALTQGGDLNAQATIRLTDAETDRQWSGMTPLHLAALNSNPAVTEALLARGANVNARSHHGLTPLHTAARLGGSQHVRALLNGGAQIEARDDDGRTPLHWALEGDPNIPGLLLDWGANIEAKNNDGFTPLHWAAAYMEAAAFFLVRRAADTMATDNTGRIPCQVYGAANQGLGTSGMIELLCPATPIADRASTERVVTLDWVEETPLHRAAYEGSPSEVQALLDQGSDILQKLDLKLQDASDTTFSWNGVTPLHLAALNSDPAVAASLIDRGVPIDIRDEYQRTPLMAAVMWFPSPAVITLLLDRGADIEAFDYDRFPVLLLAVQQASLYPSRSIDEGHQAIIPLLLDRGASMTSLPQGMLCNMVFGVPYFDEDLEDRLCGRDLEPIRPLADVQWVTETPLHRAAYGSRATEVRQLLNQGADIHATVTVKPDRAELAPSELTGATPLHLAMLNPEQSVTSLLLDRGANIETKTAGGWTPLLWAAVYGNADAAVELLENGANPNVADSIREFTPLHWAAANRDGGLVRVLMDRGADPSATDKQGNTPCQEGLDRGYSTNERFMERLCLNDTPPPSPVEGVQWFTETPLHRAAYDGSLDQVRTLLDQGADIEAEADISVDGLNWEGVTPLHVATLNPDMAVAELLLDRGSDIHARAFANGWWPVVHFALLSQRSDELQSMINFLVSRGATI